MIKWDNKPVKGVSVVEICLANSEPVSYLRLKNSGADVNQQTASPLLNVP